jgi:hypothetical protein
VIVGGTIAILLALWIAAQVVGNAIEDGLSGLGSSDDTSLAGDAPFDTATSTPPADPADAEKAFMADIAAAGFGGKDTSDRGFIQVGTDTVCGEGFANGLSREEIVSALAEEDARATTNQAESLVTSAVQNFCPEYADQLAP